MVRRTQQLGLSLVITLRPVSRWGGGNVRSPGDLPPIRYSAMPRDMDAWKEFVRRFVERYDGDGIDDMPGLRIPIRYWQVENEILWQWQGSMEEYLHFLAETSAVIRSADPQARVILGGLTQCVALAVGAGIGDKQFITYGDENPQQYPREEVIKSSKYRNYRQKVDVLLAGCDPHCDIVDFHDYGDDATDLALVVQWFKGQMQRHGYSKPIWSLENAGPFFEFSERAFAEDVVKRHVVALASGIERMFWSSLTPTLEWGENFQRLALKNQSGDRTPAYETYRTMAARLDGFLTVEQISDQPDLDHYRFRFPDGRWVDVAWSDARQGDAARTVSLTVPETAHAIELVSGIAGGPGSQSSTRRLKAENGAVQVELTSPVLISPARP